jgi:predicted DNA-binding transcriptional regulator AlpA
MSEPRKIIPLKREIEDTRQLFTLTVAEFRQLLAEFGREAKPEAPVDRLLDARAAAQLLGVSVEWIFHNRKKLPFAVKLGPKSLRFSLNGLREWIEAKRR